MNQASLTDDDDDQRIKSVSKEIDEWGASEFLKKATRLNLQLLTQKMQAQKTQTTIAEHKLIQSTLCDAAKTIALADQINTHSDDDIAEVVTVRRQE